jgi:hypothetical protein
MPVGTPVYAAYAGQVLAPSPAGPGLIESNTGYNPWGGEVDTLVNLPGIGQVVNYVFHLDQLVVQPGQQIAAGQLIGYSGGENSLTGLGPNDLVPGYTPQTSVPPNYSTGPHIEWGLYPKTGQEPIDPTPYLNQLRRTGINLLGNGSSGSGGGLVNVSFPTVQDIKTGFTDATQRIGLVMFGGLLVLVGILVVFFASESGQAITRDVTRGATEAAVVA